MNDLSCDVTVIGLGRIGLPIALNCSNRGFVVLGVDTNENTVSKLLKNDPPFKESGINEELNKNLNKTFFPRSSKELSSKNFATIKCIIISVGVHNINRKYTEPFEYRNMHRVINYLIDNDCLKGRLLIIRPTQPIGSTRKVVEYIKSMTSYIEGIDYFIAYVPERILEGQALIEESMLPKIVGTLNDKSFDVAKEFFNKMGGDIKKVSSPEVAEFVKLLDNSWRHTRFAFANDAALAAEHTRVDILEAIDAANYNYPRNSIAHPGPVSGYCLGKDPYIFEYAFRGQELKRGFNSIWYYSILSSKYILDYSISKVQGNKVLILGLSFKKDIDDYRLSHGTYLVRELLESGHEICVFDKYYGENDYTILPREIEGIITIIKELKELENISAHDTVIVTIDNQEFMNISKLLVRHGMVIDLWGIYREDKDIFKDYWALGRGNL